MQTKNKTELVSITRAGLEVRVPTVHSCGMLQPNTGTRMYLLFRRVRVSRVSDCHCKVQGDSDLSVSVEGLLAMHIATIFPHHPQRL
jgi:hypothetical protein